ncbi:MAG: HDOD domain-containing protein [Candidatus Korobacteraceae bacterium]
MNLAAPARPLARPPVAIATEVDASATIRCGRSPALVLPLLTRSISLLTLLLQDSAVDLELAGAVIGLDPALAFGTLQLANRDRGEGEDAIWQLPLAVVAAGREGLQQLLQRAPRIECSGHMGKQTRLCRLVANAATRAAVGHLLARELGSSIPRKAYLSGLLFELPAMVRLAAPAISQAELLPAMCHALPAAMVRAAMGLPDDGEEAPRDPLLAIGLIADAVLGAVAEPSSLTVALEELAAGPLWHCWEASSTQQRAFLLEHGCELAGWVRANLEDMDPWEFMARLERRNGWE